MKRIIIAIDGFSSCGKSTMAKALARNIGYLYFDSGAMYRAVALFCMQNGLINGEEIDMASLFSGGSSGGPSFGWNDLAVQIARESIIGNVSDVDEEPLFSIISIMWTNHKENKQYESLHKAAKSK